MCIQRIYISRQNTKKPIIAVTDKNKKLSCSVVSMMAHIERKGKGK